MSENEEQLNELEFAMQAGRDGKLSLATVFQVLLRSPIWVLLNKEVEEGDKPDDVQALLVKDQEGKPLIAMFSNPEHAESVKEKNPDYPHPRQVPAAGILDNIAPQVGVVINPGKQVSLQIHAEGVVELKNHLGQGFLKNIPVETGDSGSSAGH